MSRMKIAAAIAVLMLSTGAAAQEVGKPDRIVLEAQAGSVMTTKGGDYQTANTGELLVNGQSMMLGEGASATVVYYYVDSDGDLVRKCTERYTGANTYVIDDSCVAAAWTPNGSPGKSAMVIIGAGLIGAAILGSMDDVPVGPLSTGPNGSIRHF
jgi:hypothetical protein